jgi:PAS domain S-box-containing protein
VVARDSGTGEQSLQLQIDGLRGVAIFMLDAEGRVASWNAGAERFKGYEAREILGKDFECFYLPEDVAAGLPKRELRLAEQNGHFEDEGWRVRKDGSKLWANVILTAIRDPHGKLLGFGKVTRDLSERKRSVEQFRLAIEAAPTGMLMMDDTGAIVLVNVQIEKLFGYPREELLGKRIEMLVPERFRSRHPDFRKAFFADPKARAMGGGRELYGLRKDGSEMPIEIGLNPLQTSEGSFVLSSVVDITERKRSVEQFRLAIEAAPTGMLMMDDKGAIVLVNAQVEKLFGYQREDLLGNRIEMLVPERYRSRHPDFRKAFFADPKSRAMGGGRELYGLRKDGSEMPIEIGLNPLQTPEGNFVLSSVVDITERRRSVEQFRLAIEAAPTGMLMMDKGGVIVLVNAQVEKLFGYPREEILGKKIEMLVPERFRVRHPEFRKSFFGDPRARAMGGGRELYGLRKDGSEVPVEIGLNPLQTSEGDFVLSSVVDITERKRADVERENLLGQLRTLNTDLERRVTERTSELSATLREREVLLQEIHHRVKNNLQVISSLINMQVRQLEDNSSRDALEECQTRVQAIALIHEKLYQSKDYSRVPFSEYAKSLVANVFSAAGVSRSAVALHLAMEDLSLGVDKAIPCGLILNELITNALKHAFPNQRHGTVRVELRRDGERDVVFAVIDDGVGMPAEFHMNDSPSLGMSLVHTLVEQLDGSIEIIRDAGTTFQVRFPMELER